MAATDDAGAVEREARHLAGDDAGGDEDLGGGECLLLAVRPLDLDDTGFGNARVAAYVVDLVLLEEELDAAGEFVGDLAGAADNLAPIVFQAGDLQSEVGGVMADEGVEFGILE